MFNIQWMLQDMKTYFSVISVVEPIHFGPDPASASQDGGSGSSSSPVVHNLLLKKVLKILSSQFTGALFTERDRLILFCIIVKIFVYFFSLHMGSELEPELEPELPLFSGRPRSKTLSVINESQKFQNSQGCATDFLTVV